MDSNRPYIFYFIHLPTLLSTKNRQGLKLNKFGSLESYRSLTFLKFDLSNNSLRCVLSVREIPSIWRTS